MNVMSFVTNIHKTGYTEKYWVEKNMEIKKILNLAKPYLEKNDFGVEHTNRVFGIAKKKFHYSSGTTGISVFFYNPSRYRWKHC